MKIGFSETDLDGILSIEINGEKMGQIVQGMDCGSWLVYFKHTSVNGKSTRELDGVEFDVLNDAQKFIKKHFKK